MAIGSRNVTLVMPTILVLGFCVFLYISHSDTLSPKEELHKSQDEQKNYFVSSNDVLSFQSGKGSEMNHQALLQYIRGHIVGPSSKDYNLWKSTDKYFSQAGQDEFIDKTLHQLKNGFFVECGAAAGESLSNTLFLEKYRNWSGLLIEANPFMYSKLLTKQRKAYSLNGCLSIGKIPQLVKFKPVPYLGGIEGSMDDTHLKAIKNSSFYNQELEIQCFPLISIMEALDQNHINYLSLDVEGPELEILKTIPWEKLRIDLISVEYRLWDGQSVNVTGSKMKLNKIRKFMADTTIYEEADILIIPAEKKGGDKDDEGLDVVFKRKDLVV